jgi:hypothetical protein
MATKPLFVFYQIPHSPTFALMKNTRKVRIDANNVNQNLTNAYTVAPVSSTCRS